MRVDIYIQGQRVTQFEDDESILINRRAKDYRNIDKLFSDFSESFTVPGEPNNNLFQHYYDADIEEGFDARIKQPAKIYVDQELYKEGLISLIDLRIENNRVKHYKIQFFTEITQLKDLFAEDELSDLDFTEFNFSYNRIVVQDKLTTDDSDLIFPLISYKRRFLYNTSGSIDFENTTDISTNNGERGVDWRELKPAIKFNRIIQAITSEYELNFTGSIFQDSRYLELYMTLNGNRNSDDSLLTNKLIVSRTVNISTVTNFFLNTNITPDSNSNEVPYNIKYFINDELKAESLNQTGDQIFEEFFNASQFPDVITYRVIVQAANDFTFDFTFNFNSTDPNLADTQTGTAVELLPDVSVSGVLFQEFKVVDFFKAFIKMFNLVIIPTSETSFEFVSLQDWYAQGKTIDITRYVDNQNYKVSPGKLINRLDFTFDKNETFLSDEFKKQNNRGYGNLKLKLEDDNGRKLRGDAIEVKLPFEKPIFERIKESDTGVQYGFFVDDKQDEFEPFHAVFYSQVITGGFEIYLVDSNDSNYFRELNSVHMPFNSLNGFHIGFRNEIDEFSGDITTDNLFASYYEDYITDLYSTKRKNYFKKSRIPAHIMQNLKLNDRLVIGQRRYIINSLQENIITGSQELDLFNDIFTGEESV